MNDEPKVKVPDFMELLIQLLADRVKDKLMEEIARMVSANLPHIQADDIEGLDQAIDLSLETRQRNGDFKIDADDVQDLEDFIKSVINNGTISVSF